jgi:SPP1 gp7 family putative phage head morphogenesis protein
MLSEFEIFDFATPDEEALRVLETLILQRTLEARKRAVEILAKYIAMSYYTGAEKAIDQLKLPVQPTSIGVQGLDAVINELSPILEETFGYLAKDLTDVIEDGIKNNLTYTQIKQQLQEKLKTFGDRIPFRRAGQYREIVQVSPYSGKLKLVKKKIKRNVTIKTEAYANMLARTATKKAYALGHIEGYKQAGIRKWRYTAVADERTRPEHLALHGKIFEVGSEEEQLALKVMGEPNCRCRPIPFFDDPKYDTPAEVYEREKKEWAKQALDEMYLDQGARYVASISFGDKRTKERMISDLADKFRRNEKSRMLIGIAKIKMQEQIIKTFDTLHQNFTHNGVKHAVRHASREKFKIFEILEVKRTGKLIGRLEETEVYWGTSKHGTQLALYISDGRIRTAYKCPEHCLKDLLKRVKR